MERSSCCILDRCSDTTSQLTGSGNMPSNVDGGNEQILLPMARRRVIGYCRVIQALVENESGRGS